MKYELIAIAIVSFVIGFYAAYGFTRTDYIPPSVVDEMLDENTSVLTAQIRDKQDIIDLMAEESRAMVERIEEQDERILSYTRLEAWLNLTEDLNELSVAEPRRLANIATLDETGTMRYQDSVVSERTTFTQGLFEVTCTITFDSSGCYTIRPSLKQLRPITISHTVTEQAPGFVNSYVYLPDFDMESTEEITFQPPVETQKTFFGEYGKNIAVYGGILVGVSIILRALF